MKFYIGVSQQTQINAIEDYMMISYRVLRTRKKPFHIPEHLNWIMDSGAFQELKLNGKYTFTPQEYFEKVLEYRPTAFVNMDYMCEPAQLQKTGMTIERHQQLSIENQEILRDLAKDYGMTLMGTIQGWAVEDYLKHIDLMKERGLLLPYMGIGSICRRNQTNRIMEIIKSISKYIPQIKLHGFGVKSTILKTEVRDLLYSADSMAWCYNGRMKTNKVVGIGGDLYNHNCLTNAPIKCSKHTDDCANCEVYMRYWLDNIHSILSQQNIGIS